MDKRTHIDSQEAALGLWRMPHLDQALVTILERSLFTDSSRAQAQVAEQYKKIQALSLGRGKNLVLDFVLARAHRLRPRRVKKQFVVRPRKPAELLVKDCKAMTVLKMTCDESGDFARRDARVSHVPFSIKRSRPGV